MVCLGIDPGLVTCGFGIVENKLGKVVLLDYGAVRMSSKQTVPERISFLFSIFETKIQQFSVTDLSLETPFLGKNAQAFVKLGYVRGILYLLSHRYNLRLHELSPREVKLALTGYGAADKQQLSWVVSRLLPGFNATGPMDVSDALSLALCGLWQTRIS